ncbi:MAG TPA: S8 family serine peptidase [Solirubrobacteraceae bacterium]|nr:S8 family serine peptidase [Solirubrobacteraceae bacterium]
MPPPRLIAPLAAVAVLLAAAPAAQAARTGPTRTSAAGAPRAFRSVQAPMQFPGDASASAIRAARGTWLVGARPGAGARAVARAFGASLIGGGDYVVARAKARAMAGALRSRGLLLYAQPDALRPTKQAVPDDPKSVPPDAWRAAVADPDLAPPPVSPTSPLIALIDTRLDETHPEWAGDPFISTLANRPLDNLHGTATASVAVAPQNGVGILGVWPGARALNIPIGADALTCSASARAVRAAIRARAAVINMSYGSRSLCLAEYSALQLAVRRGIVPVAAAGNEFDAGNPLEFPASLPHVLTIAAVNAGLDSSSFSNANPAVDLSAPGESIMTAVPPAFDTEDDAQDGYMRLDGTSFSAPMVSAAVAWVRAARPDLSPDQVAQTVRVSARDLGRKGFDDSTGFGLLDVGAALTKRPPPRDPVEPNDDMVWVDGRAFGQAAPAVFRGRRTARLVGLVDAYEDPADVYRIRVRKRSKVRVIARPVFGDPILAGFSSGTKSLSKCTRTRCRTSPRLATSRRKGSRTESITLRNPSARTRTIYVAVAPQPGGRSLDAAYRLTIRR